MAAEVRSRRGGLMSPTVVIEGRGDGVRTEEIVEVGRGRNSSVEVGRGRNSSVSKLVVRLAQRGRGKGNPGVKVGE